ncbi:MAG: Gfo/Idh/MocA family oxidoreductase [Lachnospiraceae bacterium]|nr:Gfo/Idh/MocA family oxidoreductase [Lachnospiraceae bacterium]
MSVKFGIVGFGFVGHIHEKGLVDEFQEEVKITAICDIVPERMDDALSADARKYTRADELFADPEVDVAVICVPNHLHLEMVEKAARAGKSILCEKPAAMNLQEFEKMMQIVKSCGVSFTVHHQRRFDKDFRTIKAAYDAQEVGRPYMLQSKLYGFNGNMHDWHVYNQYGGGMLLDWGVHLIDQFLWMIDSPVKTVYAIMKNVINFEVDDYFKIILGFENGMFGEIELGTYFLKDQDNWFTHHWILAGDKGTAYCDGFAPSNGTVATTTRLLTSVEGKLTMTASGPTRSFGGPEPGLIVTKHLPMATTSYGDYYRNYLAAYHGKEEFLVTEEEMRRLLTVVEAVRKSAAENRTVEL